MQDFVIAINQIEVLENKLNEVAEAKEKLVRELDELRPGQGTVPPPPPPPGEVPQALPPPSSSGVVPPPPVPGAPPCAPVPPPPAMAPVVQGPAPKPSVKPPKPMKAIFWMKIPDKMIGKTVFCDINEEDYPADKEELLEKFSIAVHILVYLPKQDHISARKKE